MSASEFDLIARYFTPDYAPDSGVRLGVGDDCALVRVPEGHELVVTTDTMVRGVHFPEDTDPRALGHKALAVNLSDVAAMGADARWVTLALTLPRGDEAWLAAFAEGFRDLARQSGVSLIGGDTTHGPLAITVQALGSVPSGQALLRSGAQAGDLVAVTGTLGDGGLGLASRLGERSIEGPDREFLEDRLDRPTPRLAAGRVLRGLATAAIDISDGLLADLGHVLERSGVSGATIELDHLPLSEAFRRQCSGEPEWSLALSSGDDYELLFTIRPEDRERIPKSVDATVIGTLGGQGIRCLKPDGSVLETSRRGYNHFAEDDDHG